MQIPKPLQKQQYRFCTIPKGSKKPFPYFWQCETVEEAQKSWTNKMKTNEEFRKKNIPKPTQLTNYRYDDPKLLKHLENGGNYGVVCGIGGLVAVDSDEKELVEALSGFRTFEVKTGSGGKHTYFESNDWKRKIIIKDNNKHYGEIQFKGAQVVGAGSIHPNGNRYEIESFEPVAKIKAAELLNAVAHLRKKKQIESVKEKNNGFSDSFLSWLIGNNKIVKDGTGGNSILFKNYAIKFVQSGLSDNEIRNGIGQQLTNCCENRNTEMLMGWVRKARAGEIKDFNPIEIDSTIRLNKWDFDINQIKEEVKPKRKFNVVWESEFRSIKIEPIKWYVENYIPEGSIVFWAGKRATFKSCTMLHLAVCLAEGKPLFNKFPTEKISVLYIDEENGIQELKSRIEKVKASMGIENDVENLGFLSKESFKIDSPEWKTLLEDFLKDHSPCVIIADAFRRIISCEENSATEVNNVLTECIQPVSKKYGATWILIHHLRKGGNRTDSSDRMEGLRGSSEMVNYADIVLINERKGSNRFILRQEKCRKAMEQQGQIIEVEWNEEGIKLNYVGTAEDILNDVEVVGKKIMVWVIEENIKLFKTSEAYTAMKGHSKKTVGRALKELAVSGKLTKPKKGYYEPVLVDNESNGLKSPDQSDLLGNGSEESNNNNKVLETNKQETNNGTKELDTICQSLESQKKQYLKCAGCDKKGIHEVKDPFSKENMFLCNGCKNQYDKQHEVKRYE